MKLKEVTGKLNKKVVAAMVIAALLIATFAGVTGVKHAMAKASEEETMSSTIPVTKQDIKKTLSATGTIISAEESGQFASVSGSYPVAEVYVKVGDVVKKGDPLYKLDMTTMEQTLSYQQQALGIQNEQNAISSANANKALQDAGYSGAVSVNDANRALEQAKQDKATADRNKANSNNQLESAKGTEGNAKSELDSANATVSAAQNKVNSLNTKISDLQNKIANPGTTTKEVTDEDGNMTTEKVAVDVSALKSQLETAKADLETAKNELDSAIANRDSKKANYESAVSARQSAEQGVQSANDSASTASRSVDSAQAAADNAQITANNNIISQSQAVRSNELSSKSSTLSMEQEIAKSKEELGKAVVYATQDGTVTNVNIVAGQTYTGTDAIVIDNVTSLKATTDIDEAQIPQVAVGQKVQIKTDATGDDILNGTVVFVSPTATKNSTKTTDAASTTASVSKSRATYRVDVALDDSNENLRLGMTAKMTFITADAKNALVVPSSDLQTDFDGNKYVVVKKEDGSTENVTVVTGISDDFYTEIKEGDIKENDIIIESAGDSSADAVIDELGSDGGIYID